MSHEEKLMEIYRQLGVEVFNEQSQQVKALKEIERLQTIREYYEESINPFINGYIEEDNYYDI